MTPEGSHEPLWYKDAIIYQLHVKAFADSDHDGIGDFDGLTDRLGYLEELGVTAVWLLPFYPSPLRDDGYDIADYEGVNPAYGDMPAFRRFLKQAHSVGLRVVTELVINHTSDEHVWFQRARRSPKGSAARRYYVWSDSPERYPEARVIFQDFESSNWTWDPVAGQYFWHRFYSHQPDLNFDNPVVRREVLRIMDKWLGLGVDGVRLDAIPYLFEREGTNCENLPETHAFLRELRSHVDSRFENRMLLAEANQWPEDAVAYFGNGDECHMAFHFPVMPRLYMALQMEDRHPIVDILEQTPEIPPAAQWAMFLRNHDELTLEMVTDEERDYMYRAYAHDPQMRINLGIRRRLAPLLQNDRRKIELLNALLFSLPGTPLLYYGDEIGMGDNVYLGDRDGVRTPMQWSADRNAGFSRANPQQLYLPVNIDPGYHYETVNVEAQRANPSSLWWWMHRLIALRRAHGVFGRGDLEFLDPENPKVLAYLRTPRPGDDGDVILVVANLSRYAQSVELDLSAHDGATPVELFGHTAFAPIGELPYYLTMAPYVFYWLRLESKPVEVEAPPVSGQLPVISLPAGSRLPASTGPLTKALAAWLPGRRWFAGKSRTIGSVKVNDSIELGDGEAHLLLISVEFAQGDPDTYCVPVAAVWSAHADDIMARQPDLAIARIRRSGSEGLLIDALGHPQVALSLARLATGRRGSRRERKGMVEGWATSALRQIMRSGNLSVSLSAGEQSNTSVRLGEQALLKLYRRLDEGTSPELEIGRHLRATGFRHAAPLLGSVEYGRRHQEPMTLAVVHEHIPNEGDGWSHALDRLGSFYDQVLAHVQSPRPEIFPTGFLPSREEEVPPLVGGLIGTFLTSAELLGRRTAEMHIALASGEDPAFAPEPFTTLYQRSLYQSLRGEVRATTRAVKAGRTRWPEILGEFTLDEGRIGARLDQIRTQRIATMRTRLHGDYHLGQVLWNGMDFVIIDFEGEPARAVSQRRLKRSPLRDVAGMIRSFHYAAEAGLRRQVDRGAFEDVAAARTQLGQWNRLWVAWITNRYLTGYLVVAGDQPFVPTEESDLRLLLDVFLLEKAGYELRYELDHRPGWADIPLGYLAELVASFPEEVGS